jgi:hypothetical protein
MTGTDGEERRILSIILLHPPAFNNVLSNINLWSSFRVKDQHSHSYTAVCKTTVMDTLIFGLEAEGGMTKACWDEWQPAFAMT